MKLIDFYSVPTGIAEDIAWRVMAESPPEANISHKQMPTWDGHMAYIASRPQLAWYVVDIGQDDYAGTVALSEKWEITIRILRRFRGFGYGKMATQMLMDKHGPGRYLANIAPRNFVSQTMFTDIGFRLAQHTYELQKAST